MTLLDTEPCLLLFCKRARVCRGRTAADCSHALDPLGHRLISSGISVYHSFMDREQSFVAGPVLVEQKAAMYSVINK